MIFLRYESFRDYLKLYPVTSMIIGINTLLLVLMMLNGGSTNGEVLLRFGALYNVEPYASEAWRYVSAMFLHIGIEHWLFNTFALFVFAPPLEKIMGKIRYAALYMVSGIAGNIVSEFIGTDVHLSAGASGAIFGIYGAFIFMALYRKGLLDQQSRTTITTILVIGLIYSFMPHVNLYAHVGGFVGGMLSFRLLYKL